MRLADDNECLIVLSREFSFMSKTKAQFNKQLSSCAAGTGCFYAGWQFGTLGMHIVVIVDLRGMEDVP